MNGKIFDAASRVLLCGLAVVLLTALAIPELVELGIEEEEAKTLWAPLVSIMIVSLFYSFLSAGPRWRRFGKSKMDGGKTAICAFLSVLLALIVTIPLDLDDTELDWLPVALGAAIMTMGQSVSMEWHLLELEFKGPPRGPDGD